MSFLLESQVNSYNNSCDTFEFILILKIPLIYFMILWNNYFRISAKSYKNSISNIIAKRIL
jgi:hypothetical protein